MAVTASTGSGLGGVTEILKLLGGNSSTSTSNAGDTTELQKIIAESGTNPEAENALLTAIFQNAAGQIPGLQTAFSNALGARGGNNSAVTAALSRLLQQTTTSAQQQIMAQRQQAMQTRANAATAIAQATKGTTTKQKGGTNLGQAGMIIGGLQLFSKLRGMMDDEDGIGGALQKAIGGDSAGTGSAVTPVMQGNVQSEAIAPMEISPTPVDEPIMDFGDGGTQIGADDASLYDDVPLEIDTNNDDLTGGFSDEPLDLNFS